MWNRDDTHILANVTEIEKTTKVEEQTGVEKSENLDSCEYRIAKIIDVSRFSSYKKLLNVTSYVLRFLHNCKGIERRTGPLKVAEIEESSIMWIRNAQHTHFPEIERDLQWTGSSKHCLAKQLSLYVDDDDLLRSKGRIHNAPLSDMAKHPIILPTKDELTKLIVMDAHRKSLHSGLSSTITLLRQNFWIPKMRQTVKNVLRKCVICRKLTGKPYAAAQTPPLPKDRLREEPPFTVTGVDFTGALKVRKKDGQEGKAYICLFTCASTRAVHLEVVTDLTEEQFILAFRRFSSRKSLPRIMISDNATTYVASAKEIQRLTSSPTLQETLNTHGTTWKFIPKRAPWYGGFYERLIGLTKNCIRKVLGRSFVSVDVLNTVITEVECILNDRPLTYVSSDPLDEDPLTPSHLLYGRTIVSLSYPSNVPDSSGSTKDLNHYSANKRYNAQSQCIQHFWSRWRKEYLTSLREYQRNGGHNEQNIQEGEIVQIHDENPRILWKLAKIEKLVPGNDGLVRSVVLRTKTGVTTRPVSKLYPLELNLHETIANPSATKDREAKQRAKERIKTLAK